MLHIEQKDSGWNEAGNGEFTFLDGNKDTVAYELKKYLMLASKCNPNILEILFEDEKYYEYINPLGRILIDARELLEIRLGNLPYDYIVQEADKLFARLDVSYEKSTLPHHVDANLINELCVNLVEASIFSASD